MNVLIKYALLLLCAFIVTTSINAHAKQENSLHDSYALNTQAKNPLVKNRLPNSAPFTRKYVHQAGRYHV